MTVDRFKVAFLIINRELLLIIYQLACPSISVFNFFYCIYLKDLQHKKDM